MPDWTLQGRMLFSWFFREALKNMGFLEGGSPHASCGEFRGRTDFLLLILIASSPSIGGKIRITIKIKNPHLTSIACFLCLLHR